MDPIEYMKKLVFDAQEEIKRVDQFRNVNNHHNGTAINAITRRYTKELNEFIQLVMEDLETIEGNE